MAEVSEVFDDLGENVKKTGKNFKKFLKEHPFAIVVIAVGGIALFIGLRNSGEETETETGGEYYYPSGYGGYPSMEGGSYGESYYGSSSESMNSSSSVTESLTQEQIDSINQQWQDKLNSTIKEYDSLIGEYEDTIFAYDEDIAEFETLTEEQAAAIQYQNVISQMTANSEMYAQTTDKALREQLHAENLALASMYGLKFDSKTGNYFYDDGTPVYLSAKQQLNSVTPILGNSASVMDKNFGSIGMDYAGNAGYTSNLRTYNGVTYDVTVDYASKIQEAYNAGYYYGDDYFNQLLSARDAKVKGEGLDPETGKKIGASQSTAYNGTSYNLNSTNGIPVVNTQTAGKPTQQITYDRNTDYAALINAAKAAGASQSYIDQLQAQRQAKIAGENLDQYGRPKTTTSSKSSSSSSSSKSGSTTSTAKKTTSTTSGKSTSSSHGGVSYDKNVDYAAAINKAVASGASQSYIDQLQRQRQAKIAGENLNNDGTKKK